MDLAIYRKSFIPVNIKDLFIDKNPSLARWIPGLIYRYLSRILRIDFVNDTSLWHHGHKKNVDGIFVPINKHGAQAMEDIRRIKANLEMIFLPNESFKHKNEHFVITFGKPIPYDTFDKRFSPNEWAQMVKDHAYSLADDPRRNFSHLQN